MWTQRCAPLTLLSVLFFYFACVFPLTWNTRRQTALSLIVCNLLVIVAFTHRICNRDGDPEERDSLTSVDLNTGITESAADKYTTTVVQHSMVLEMSSRTTTRTVDVEEAGGSVESK